MEGGIEKAPYHFPLLVHAAVFLKKQKLKTKAR